MRRRGQELTAVKTGGEMASVGLNLYTGSAPSTTRLGYALKEGSASASSIQISDPKHPNTRRLCESNHGVSYHGWEAYPTQ